MLKNTIWVDFLDILDGYHVKYNVNYVISNECEKSIWCKVDFSAKAQQSWASLEMTRHLRFSSSLAGQAIAQNDICVIKKDQVLRLGLFYDASYDFFVFRYIITWKRFFIINSEPRKSLLVSYLPDLLLR